jgi:arylsulfatase A-like enzyme
MKIYSRRTFLSYVAAATAVSIFPYCSNKKQSKPNIILLMADDLGWGDTRYSGHSVLKTPFLDEMSRNGLRFDRFYSAAPVCSPTRGSCLTGRHPYRYGIFNANVGHLPEEEVTLAEVLKPRGYATGHFGKWHLGTLTKTVNDSNRGGGRGEEFYSPPWENGFDVCFSTEAKVPTYDPMRKPAGWDDKRWWNPVQPGQSYEKFNTRYWTCPGEIARNNLTGDDSKIIMDQAINFIQDSLKNESQFFAVIWFHAPHWPVVAAEKYRKMYSHLDEFRQNHFGSITALDEQIGRLREELKNHGIDKNTLLWFCSDNGPEGTVADGKNHGAGSAGVLKGRKRSLYEGGIRVPGLLEWPDKIKTGRNVKIPCCTSDYFPTILDILGVKSSERPGPVDGISLLPLIEEEMKSRFSPIAFESGKQLALIENRYKIISQDQGVTFELFDIIEDPEENRNLSNEKPQILNSMAAELNKWRKSCEESREGKDYI